MARKVDQQVVLEVLDGDPLMTPREVMDALGMTAAQLYYRVEQGEIAVVRAGRQRRYRTSEIRAYDAAHPRI